MLHFMSFEMNKSLNSDFQAAYGDILIGLSNLKLWVLKMYGYDGSCFCSY